MKFPWPSTVHDHPVSFTELMTSRIDLYWKSKFPVAASESMTFVKNGYARFAESIQSPRILERDHTLAQFAKSLSPRSVESPRAVSSTYSPDAHTSRHILVIKPVYTTLPDVLYLSVEIILMISPSMVVLIGTLSFTFTSPCPPFI